MKKIKINFKNKKLKFVFVGIGGIGMSALACYLSNKNYSVQGCDSELNNKTIKNCIKNKIKIYNEKTSLNKIKNVDNIFTKSLGSKTSTDWQEADREIRIVAIKNISGTDNYFVWDLGSSNYLTELSYSGGEAGGENVEATI